MLNNNVVKFVGGVVAGYVGARLLCRTAKEIKKVVETNKIKNGNLVKIDGEYCEAEWIPAGN